ncbi:uncharacterized protein LOC116111791 [Pistacia vera]|uniref:Uncharacterized protein n=1 Tax=Pistacia atlantica TaxID=434234 RepID=A0ACC1A5F5_9ROSI|nr:uncharacterized protein LOC116105207 [Pistacia vera]XP_031247502.1 uncharacterized protein LOC116105208 [Pistacia vera]XP_031253804.1 uncharacterized protein LOC116111791 [Pistacia vera]KAJ0081268.1 hypothetical protein Patl1_10037 [Pistacia atlantica]
MGNCIRRESSNMVWAGDDWEFSSRGRVMDDIDDDKHGERNAGDVNVEKRRLLSEKGGFSSSSSLSSSSPSTREVKIKISKKELEELVHRVDMQGLSLKQVLEKLIDANIDHHHHLEHQRSWRPVLQSIPEVD